MVTIFKALQNGNYNLGNVKKKGIEFFPLAKNQINNAVVLLEKGYLLSEHVEPLLEKYGSVENVPDKE